MASILEQEAVPKASKRPPAFLYADVFVAGVMGLKRMLAPDPITPILADRFP
jgi:hypothetical protein